MSKLWVGMKLNQEMKLNWLPYNLQLPNGCEGILFVFKTKKAGRDFLGNNVTFREMKEVSDENNHRCIGRKRSN